jgi:hypothetical protein
MQQPNTLQEPPDLTPDLKNRWNKFIDFVANQKMAGNPTLDQRNKQVGMGLLQKFNFANPKQALPMNIVPQVQAELNAYRTNLVNNWKAGKAQIDGVKTENDIMPNLSQTDGWPGTKTLASKFPVASMTTTTPTSTATKSYGTDLDAYDKDRGIVSK